MGVPALTGILWDLQARCISQQGGEERALMCALRQKMIDVAQVAPGQRRQGLGKPVVEADPGHRGLPAGRALPMGTERAGSRVMGRIVGYQESALAAAEYLSVLHAEAADLSECAGSSAIGYRAEGLACVFDDVQAMTNGEIREPVRVGGTAPQVDWQHGPGRGSALGGEIVMVDLPAGRAVDKHGPGTGIGDR